jgi:predicted RNA polymerase sigma factor
VLEVVYLIFNEGYTAARGQDWLRPQLCHEALRMGRVLTAIAAHEPEAHGLLALMELNASRAAARIDSNGEPILLLDQDWALCSISLDATQKRRRLSKRPRRWPATDANMIC